VFTSEQVCLSVPSIIKVVLETPKKRRYLFGVNLIIGAPFNKHAIPFFGWGGERSLVLLHRAVVIVQKNYCPFQSYRALVKVAYDLQRGPGKKNELV